MCSKMSRLTLNYYSINQKCTPAEARPRMCAQKRLARGGDVKKCAQKSRAGGKCAHIRLWRGGEVARWRFPPFTTAHPSGSVSQSVILCKRKSQQFKGKRLAQGLRGRRLWVGGARRNQKCENSSEEEEEEETGPARHSTHSRNTTPKATTTANKPNRLSRVC